MQEKLGIQMEDISDFEYEDFVKEREQYLNMIKEPNG